MRLTGKLESGGFLENASYSGSGSSFCIALPALRAGAQPRHPDAGWQVNGLVVEASTQGAIPADVRLIVDTATTIDYFGFDARSGAFEFPNLPIGNAILTVHAEGYSPAWTEFLAIPGDRTVRLSLKLETILTGVVVNGRGDPVAGVFVETAYSDEVGAYGLLDSLTCGQLLTNANGEFSLRGVVADAPVTLQATTTSGTVSGAVTVSTATGRAQGGIVLHVP